MLQILLQMSTLASGPGEILDSILEEDDILQDS